MVRLVSNIPIFRRLFYAFLLAAIVPVIMISVLGIAFLNAQGTRSQAMQISTRMVEDALNASLALQRSRDLLNVASEQYKAQGFRSSHQTQALLNTLASNEKTFASTLAHYPQLYQLSSATQLNGTRAIVQTNDPKSTLMQDQQHALQQANTLWIRYRDAQEQTIQALQNGGNIDAPLAQANTSYTPMQTAWAGVVQIAEQVSNTVAQVSPSQINPIILTIALALLITLIVVIAIGYIVNLTITHPLSQLTALTRSIARGETEARANIPGRDEINMVAASMNSMLDNIVRLIQETKSQRDILQAQVEKLVSEVSGVGEGDLRVQAEVTADALGVLADSFNYMVEELGSLVIRVKVVAHEVETSTTTVLERMMQLVETGDMQIQQISDAAIEVERSAASSRQVADRSQRLYRVARVARQDAQTGRESVQQAIEGMGRINENVKATSSKVQTLGERSREIDEIVEAIASIAHQTNRLALDAAIQAAMAGENGKGFGAVAADIRRLAERAKDQAGMIAHIVRSVREDIGAAAISMHDTERETAAGTRLTQEAGIALESIFAAVEHQAHEIEAINQVALNQLNSSSSVVQIMHEVSESTQQSGLNTREASQSMERLTCLVEQLRSSVEAFKMRENQDYLTHKKGENVEDIDTPLSFSGIFRTVTAHPPQPLSPTGNHVFPANQLINYSNGHSAWEWGTVPTPVDGNRQG
ncbi:MAG TPA: methyl-accepting chemotaxis protein [Ktedonobacteraceae bacterium]|nr:methyl-accepting chemotaxis protein [Ktedonobacteraceae bacterium]